MTRHGLPHIGGARAHRVLGDVGAVLIVLLGGALPGPGQPLEWAPDLLAINAVACLVLLARHRWPFAVLGTVVGMVVLTVPLGLFNTGTVAAAAVATYATMSRLSRRAGLTATLVVAAVAVCASLLAHEGGPQPALVVLLGGALGAAIQSQRAVVAAVTERAERAERTREALARQRVAEDRLGIARDLHDVVAHQIAVISLHAGAATSALPARPSDAQRSLAIIRQASRTVLTEIGDLMATLRDPDQAEIGPPGLAQLDDVVREFAVHGLDVTVRTTGDPVELSGSVDVTALRVIQEALTNAHKHGTGRRAHVLIEYLSRSLRLTVANPVTPATDARAAIGTRQGLVAMTERVESVRGTLTYGSNGAGTWFVVADLPYGPQHRPSHGEAATG